MSVEVGDAAAWFAAGIAIIAALVALGNANSARRQAEAAERSLRATEQSARAAQTSADEARQANELTRQQHDREQARLDAAALAEARKVTMSTTGTNAVWVLVNSHSNEAFFDLVLESVTANGHPEWGWRPVQAGGMGQRRFDTLAANGKQMFLVEFVSAGGIVQPHSGDSEDCAATITYRDAAGQVWRRAMSHDPVRAS